MQESPDLVLPQTRKEGAGRCQQPAPCVAQAVCSYFTMIVPAAPFVVLVNV